MVVPFFEGENGLGYTINYIGATTTLSKTITLNTGDIISGSAFFVTIED